jgi:hypothetical protein
MAPTDGLKEGGEPLPLRVSLHPLHAPERRIPGAEVVVAMLFMGLWLGALLIFEIFAGGPLLWVAWYVHGPLLTVGILVFFGLMARLAYRGLDTRLAAARAVIVGADGVVLQRSLGRREIVPYEAIAGVKAGRGAVLLQTRGERRIALPVDDPRSRRALAGHIQRALEAARAAACIPQAALDALDRGARPRAQWVEHLRAIGRRPQSYREGTLDQEMLARVVESGGVPPERRVAAAFALASTGDGDFVRRIRVAAAASVDERLRIALERAAAEELDEPVDPAAGAARPRRRLGS